MKMAPPVMLAQLIQALYNVVDSFFVGRYSESGLTALSIIYPIQLLMIALAVGTGVGINTEMAYNLGIGKKKRSDDTAGIGTPLALVMWVLFAGVCFFLMPAYARMNTSSEEVIAMVVSYGRIVCVLSIGLFLESVWTKVHQAEGNMRVPMIAQIVGAVVNIVLDPFLIFGLCGLPKMGIAGAATATVVGQIAAAVIVMKGGCRKIPKVVVFPHQIKRIYKLGIPNILMQSAYTFYIFGLNLLLATFSDQAVTVLGLYYKWQAFFFIPLGAMQTCIVPVVSYNFAAGKYERCKKTLKVAIGFGVALMMIGVVLFETIPGQMLHVFSHDPGSYPDRSRGFPVYRNQLCAIGKFTDIPGIFPGTGACGDKLNPDDYPDRIFIYSTGLSVFEIRTELVLADISGDGFHHDIGRIPVLPEVQQKHAISCCGSVMKWQKNGYGLLVLWNKG